MTIHSPQNFREIIDQQEALNRIIGGKDFERQYFTEALELTTLMVRRPLKINACCLSAGIALEGTALEKGRLVHDLSLEESEIADGCKFQSLLVIKVLNLTKIISQGGNWHFTNVSVAPTDEADIWISFGLDSVLPKLETENEIIREMFARLSRRPTEIVSYNEIASEVK